jgi:hypothetical protein
MYYNRLDGYFRHSFSEPFEPVFERAMAPHGLGRVRISDDWTRVRRRRRPPLTEEDLRIHAWLSERLEALRHERHGLWPRAARFFRAIARFLLWPFVRKARINTD